MDDSHQKVLKARLDDRNYTVFSPWFGAILAYLSSRVAWAR